ncbi:MAG TPA: transglutaminase N-terminal domain-containing protein, partial [Stenomitos sp.]
MKYTITHTTAYTYGSEVLLNPHLLRLCPRNDGFQRLLHHSLTLSPTPKGQTTLLDAEGNLIQRCWWAEEGISALEIQAISEVETLCDNPFAYLLEPWAMHCPIDYPASLRVHLEPYLNPHHLGSLTFDPVAVQLAHEIAHSVDWNTLNFLSELNQRIYGQLTYQVREVGDPLPPQITWQQQSGS